MQRRIQFNDLLLMCSSRKIVTTSKYKLRATIHSDQLEVCCSFPPLLHFHQQDISGNSKQAPWKPLQVCEGDRLDLEHSWYILGEGGRRIELLASSGEEKREWMAALWAVIRDSGTRLNSARSPLRSSPTTESLSSRSNSRCALCSTSVKRMSLGGVFRRPAACVSCPRVFCGKCRGKGLLQSQEGEEKRKVCRDCAGHRESSQDNSSPLRETAEETEKLMEGVLEVSSKQEKEWRKRHFALGRNFVLYMTAAAGDSEKLGTLPLPGCEVAQVPGSQDTIRLSHLNRDYLLRAAGPEALAEYDSSLFLLLRSSDTDMKAHEEGYPGSQKMGASSWSHETLRVW